MEMPLRIVLAALPLLSACGVSRHAAYQAATICLANEMAWHQFVDQETKPSNMLPEDGRRMQALRAKAIGLGQSAGISENRVEHDVREEAAKMIARDQSVPLQRAALPRMEKARACLDQPRGSTKPS